MAGLFHNRTDLCQDLVNARRIHLAPVVISAGNSFSEIAASYLGGQSIRDYMACTLLLLNPGLRGQRNPNRTSIDLEADVDGISVPRSNGHNIRRPAAVQVFPGPGIRDVKILIHAAYYTVSAVESGFSGRAISADEPGETEEVPAGIPRWLDFFEMLKKKDK